MAVDVEDINDLLPLAKDTFVQFRECFVAIRRSLRFSSDEGRKVTRAELLVILPEVRDAIVSLSELYTVLDAAAKEQE